jgi:adenine phosphoribosyltransferase
MEKEDPRLTKIKSLIVSHMDFPKEGINFRDITPLFLDPSCITDLVDMAIERIKTSGIKIDAIAGLESRGFLLGVPLAMALGVPFIVIRKAGKLPGDKLRVSYGLEYG